MNIEIEYLKAKIAQHQTNELNMKKITTEKNKFVAQWSYPETDLIPYQNLLY